MNESELRQDIWKRAAILKERAAEIQAASQYGPLDEALEAVLSKLDTVQADAFEAALEVDAWLLQRAREKNA